MMSFVEKKIVQMKIFAYRKQGMRKSDPEMTKALETLSGLCLQRAEGFSSKDSSKKAAREFITAFDCGEKLGWKRQKLAQVQEKAAEQLNHAGKIMDSFDAYMDASKKYEDVAATDGKGDIQNLKGQEKCLSNALNLMSWYNGDFRERFADLMSLWLVLYKKLDGIKQQVKQLEGAAS